MCILAERLASKIFNYSCFFLNSFCLGFYSKDKLPCFLFEGATGTCIELNLRSYPSCTYVISLWSDFFFSPVLISECKAGKYKKHRTCVTQRGERAQNTKYSDTRVAAAPGPRMGLQTSSKAVTALQPSVGQAGGEDFSVACLMGCNVKYHLDSCQYITKYLKTKLPAGKDKCALKGRVRHDGLSLFTVFCMVLTKTKSFPFHRRVGCFLGIFLCVPS